MVGRLPFRQISKANFSPGKSLQNILSVIILYTSSFVVGGRKDQEVFIPDIWEELLTSCDGPQYHPKWVYICFGIIVGSNHNLDSRGGGIIHEVMNSPRRDSNYLRSHSQEGAFSSPHQCRWLGFKHRETKIWGWKRAFSKRKENRGTFWGAYR